MEKLSPQQNAGMMLRKLIQENYRSQEDFSYDYGMDIRTVSRYINNGINKIDVVQELAEFFDVPFIAFFSDQPA